MSFAEHPISGVASALVESVWTLSGSNDLPDGDANDAWPIVTDGCVELVWNLGGGRLMVDEGGGRFQPMAAGFLFGMATKTVQMRSEGEVALLGVRLRPTGAIGLLGEALAHTTDRIVPLRDMLAGLEGEIRELGLRGLARKETLAECVLKAVWKRPLIGNVRVGHALERMAATRGRVCISAVAREAGMSSRHLDRSFEKWVGLGPKMYCRVARFRAAWEMGFKVPRPEWGMVALRCGYADQAHMCRDFREFSGISPKEAEQFG